MWCVFSGRDESEFVRFGDRLGRGAEAEGVIPNVASQNRNGREGEVERESARACVSVIVTSSDPPSARPRGAAGGREGGESGVDRGYPPGLFLVLIGEGNSLGEISPERTPLTPNRDTTDVLFSCGLMHQGTAARTRSDIRST